MKKSIALLLFIVTSTIYAQNSGITYQAVIYNPSIEILPGNNNPNVVLANKEICLRFSIIDAASSLEYQEVQKVKTDEFGMVNLVVGQGNQISGYAANFGAIVWNSSNKTLAVAIDANANCSNFIEVSEQFFSAVPFAYASKVAETVSGIVPIVNGGTGAATVAGAKTNLGLNNVDNTSDLNKPVSTATQTALDARAPLASPSFTGVPTAPTAPTGTSTAQIATTAFVNAALATAAAPDATTTLKGRIQLAGDLSGTAEAPTVPGLANKEDLVNKSTDIVADANSTIKYPSVKLIKEYVDAQVSAGVADATVNQKGKVRLAGDLAGTADSPTVPGLALKAPLASPSLTGTPLAPTAAAGTNTEQIATTAFVTAATAGKQSAITLTTTGTGSASLTGSTLNIPTPNNGTVTNVAALTLGTSGTDISSTVATATTTPVISLNVPTASATNRGALSATDWTTFNNKVGGNGTTNFVPKYTGLSTLGNSSIFDDGTNVGIGTTSPSRILDVVNGLGTHKGVIEAEGPVTNSYSRAIAIRMRRGTAAAPINIQSNDISAFAFVGYDGTSFSTTAAGLAGLARENWTTTNKGMALTLSTTQNATTLLQERMRIEHNGNIGIGTTTPFSRLEVNGSATNTSAFNAESSTAIDFSKSNLAYTTANPGVFTLLNIKDGGTYTLAVRGTTSATASFIAPGFTFKSPNNGLTATGKETLYTFMVMGDIVYFYMTTGI
jgi:hypothetical protein